MSTRCVNNCGTGRCPCPKEYTEEDKAYDEALRLFNSEIAYKNSITARKRRTSKSGRSRRKPLKLLPSMRYLLD